MLPKVPTIGAGSTDLAGCVFNRGGPGEQRLSLVWRVREYSAVPIGSTPPASHPVESLPAAIMNGASMTSLPASAEAAGLPAAWLRDNCPCALYRDPGSGCCTSPTSPRTSQWLARKDRK
jgi:hypothetical protein